MPIIKIIKRDPGYAQISNALLNDSRMSWKAKGILAYLLSKPNNWKVQVGDLINRSPDGEHAVRSALNELIELGYARRDRIVDESNRVVEWDFTIYEIPQTAEELEPDRGFPDVDFPDVENRDVNNKELTNKEPRSNIVQSKKRSAKTPPAPRDIRSKHPAIQMLRGIVGRYPTKNLYDQLISTLGETPDSLRLKACYDAWTTRGYNPNAWTWALDWYITGVPTRPNGNGRKTAHDVVMNYIKQEGGDPDIDTLFEEKGEVLDGNWINPAKSFIDA